MNTNYRMTETEIAACTDSELQRIAKLGKSNPLRFGAERKIALAEMAKRAARAYRVKFDQYD